MTFSRHLNKNMRKPRKIKKIFSTKNQKKEERIKYCNKTLELGLRGKDIFFYSREYNEPKPICKRKNQIIQRK